MAEVLEAGRQRRSQSSSPNSGHCLSAVSGPLVLKSDGGGVVRTQLRAVSEYAVLSCRLLIVSGTT